MKALLSEAAGGPESLVLAEVPESKPGLGQVRLRVHACGLGFPDLLVMNDQYQTRPPRPFSPGGEVAGVVEAVGPGVSGLEAGQRVIGWCFWGGLAEQLVIDADRCIPIPDGMPMDDAASLVLSYATAYYALHERGRLQKGNTLLVTGASGGTGVAAVVLGKAWGARVVAATSSLEKLSFALKHGADVGLVYPTVLGKDASRQFVQALERAVGRAGADVVFDPVGGELAQSCMRAIGWEGRYLVIGFAAGVPKLPLNLVLLKGCQVVGVSSGEWIERDRAGFDAAVRGLLDLYRQGLLRPPISARFPLACGAEALALLARREALGKVIVTMDGS